MAEQITVMEQPEPTQSEIQQFMTLLLNADTKTILETLSQIIRALQGRSVDSDDVITRLINVKILMERSRYPTYPQVGLQVYLRLIAHYIIEGEPCKEWADTLSHALIAYKGENWKAYVDMVKGQAMMPGQEFFFGNKQLEQAQQPQIQKRHFWQGKPKEETEFKSQ